MRFSLRIFLGFFLVVGVMAYVSLDALRNEVKPAIRESIEEVLVDESQLLAAFLSEDLNDGRLDDQRFAAAIARIGDHDPAARIRDVAKHDVDMRVYVTDLHGIVLFDSAGIDTGRDYSQWRDVYLTLRGQYGARTSRDKPDDPMSSWMFVAAPVMAGERMVGVVSVGKSARSIAPHIAAVEQRLTRGAELVLLLALVLGGVFSWWLSRGIGQLTRYARRVRDGNHREGPQGNTERIPAPRFFANRELAQLSQALEEMRASLDGKEYVEEYVLGLTHELKSPLAGIAAAAEILHDELSAADREKFAGHVAAESARLRDIVEHLLQLVRLEQQQKPASIEAVHIAALLNAVRDVMAPQRKNVSLSVDAPADLMVHGEGFLLEQAVRNLVQNAMDFARADTDISLAARRDDDRVAITVDNVGEPVPDWALARVFERFFSLPRTDSAAGATAGRKGTGLGLPLVRSIAGLHGGDATLENTATGVRATLFLPCTLSAH